MLHDEFIVFATIGALMFIFSIYLFIFLLDRSPYIGWWTLGWLIYLPVNYLSYLYEISKIPSKDILFATGLFFLLTNMCNFTGTMLYVNRKPPKLLFIVLLVIMSLLMFGQQTTYSVYPLIFVIIFFVGILRLWAGIALLRSSSRNSLRYYLGLAYILYSTNIGALSFLYLNGIYKIFILFIYECIPLFIAVGFLMLYIRQTHDNYKLDEQHIKYFNIHDKLTGAYNRDYYEDIIKRLENTHEKLPLSLIICDINGLKLVNDTLGHKQGDELLKKMAYLLTSASRKDDLVVRWGGDEFIVILPCTRKNQAQEIAIRYREALALSPSEPIPLSMAIGVATLTCKEESIDDVFKKAEEEMYANKIREGNNYKLTIINALGQLLFNKDYETKEHVDRLEGLVRKMGSELNLPESQINKYCLVAKLHDIGKITIPEHVLKKHGPLNHLEWECMKKHVETGYRLALSTSEFASIAESILYHHEHWDGNGYPQGLSGYDIPLASRIIAIVDAYDVMIHNRSYKKEMSKRDAINELIRCSGTQFDPTLVDVFIKLIMPGFDEAAAG